MEAQEFIAKVLREVVGGIEDAHKMLVESGAGARGAAVAPRVVLLPGIADPFDVGLVATDQHDTQFSGEGQ